MKHDLSKFAAKAAPVAPVAQDKPRKAARGSADRPAVAVRPWSRDDWLKMQHFALQQGKSLNEILLEGFADRMARAGVPPIATTEPK